VSEGIGNLLGNEFGATETETDSNIHKDIQEEQKIEN
jgi:hypothetical protein